jgi:alpha-beta hydrolase superfamily lysophospholipase
LCASSTAFIKIAELPAIVLVPGAFHHLSQYAHLHSILEDAGHQTTTVDHPSTGGPRPLENALPDFEAVYLACKHYIDNG